MKKLHKPGKLMGAVGLAVLLLAVSAFTIVPQVNNAVPRPALLDNVIQNGSFEHNPTSGVATHWQPYDNGQAHYGWYLEQWWEAVHSGKSSQLMEIFQVDGPAPERVIAIYQTVNVTPHANYLLTMHAMMRSDAPRELRNKGDYSMAWGVDYTGQGKYHRVENWVTMPLTEQLRIGSSGPGDEARALYFQLITGTINTGASGKLALFIRGVKVNPTGTEVNFNVDDVSLLGPYAVAAPAAAPAEEETLPPPAPDNNLPAAGAVLPQPAAGPTPALAGLLLVGLGLAAVHRLLQT
jgi:hypothetical protein